MPELTREQRLNKLRNLETIAAERTQGAKEAQDEAAALRKELGDDAPPAPQKKEVESVIQRAAREDEDAKLFDRLSASGELTQLAAEDPTRFQELSDARRKAGERKLFEGKGGLSL